MVTFWLQLSDMVTFEDDYTAKIIFWTFHVNIFFILRNKRTTCKKIIVISYATLQKKISILAPKPSHKVEVPLKLNKYDKNNIKHQKIINFHPFQFYVQIFLMYIFRYCFRNKINVCSNKKYSKVTNCCFTNLNSIVSCIYQAE